MVVEILEVTMYILFGCSWPFNIAKSIKTKSTKGKSILFLILIDLGYVASMLAKIIGNIQGSFSFEKSWWVFMFVAFNFIMVTTDIFLYFINRKYEKNQLKYS